jgi:hypothetical protein
MNCISYTASCQESYGINSERNGTMEGDSYICDCKAGYEWDELQTTCVKASTCPI